MDSDRPPPHRTASASSNTTTTGDFFICFTARHHFTQRDHPTVSLTTSLSRRLRTNRSIKGGASPALFPSTGKKRSGGGFDNNPEPSSPKVTCIGQVRVKSKKKQGIDKISRSLSRKHSSSGGDANSFRKLQHSGDGVSKSLNRGSNYCNQDSFQEQRNHNNSSNNQKWVHFSCLFPCRSSCFSPSKEEKPVDGSGSCGAECTRWFVAVHDGGRRDVELVVEDEDEEDDRDIIRVSRRHVFDDLEIVNDRIVQGESPRLSICIPPKNALLLMRCRSDPLKMEALANRLWQSTDISQDDDQDEDFFDHEDEIMQKTFDLNREDIIQQEQILEINDEVVEEEEEEEDSTIFGSLFDEIDEMLDAKEVFEGNETGEYNIEKVKGFDVKSEEEMATQFQERSEYMVDESMERSSEVLEKEGLPECLLLMMCEPKLSMEVSKETWVSSKDFFRRPSSRKKPPPPPPPPQPQPVPVKPIDSQDKSKFSATTTFASTFKYDKHVAATAPVQPGRSSCSLPAPPSMAEMIEQKLVNAVGYEPFVLTRCKSEPMRTAAAKLAPDNCFWKNRKLEPLRRATCGVGAAGIGF